MSMKQTKREKVSVEDAVHNGLYALSTEKTNALRHEALALPSEQVRRAPSRIARTIGWFGSIQAAAIRDKDLLVRVPLLDGNLSTKEIEELGYKIAFLRKAVSERFQGREIHEGSFSAYAQLSSEAKTLQRQLLKAFDMLFQDSVEGRKVLKHIRRRMHNKGEDLWVQAVSDVVTLCQDTKHVAWLATLPKGEASSATRLAQIEPELVRLHGIRKNTLRNGLDTTLRDRAYSLVEHTVQRILRAARYQFSDEPIKRANYKGVVSARKRTREKSATPNLPPAHQAANDAATSPSVSGEQSIPKGVPVGALAQPHSRKSFERVCLCSSRRARSFWCPILSLLVSPLEELFKEEYAERVLMLSRTAVFVAGVLTCLCIAPCVLARSNFPDWIPNGAVHACSTCHISIGESTTWNAFGRAVKATLKEDRPDWSAVRHEDSDGDGQTNANELGDPCEIWSMGMAAAQSSDISLPGDPCSVTHRSDVSECGNASGGSRPSAAAAGESSARGRHDAAPYAAGAGTGGTRDASNAACVAFRSPPMLSVNLDAGSYSAPTDGAQERQPSATSRNAPSQSSSSESGCQMSVMPSASTRVAVWLLLLAVLVLRAMRPALGAWRIDRARDR